MPPIGIRKDKYDQAIKIPIKKHLNKYKNEQVIKHLRKQQHSYQEVFLKIIH